MQNLIQKYNVPGPRYTSYPTVPFWDEASFATQKWIESLNHPAYKNDPISLYIHLPFCESLCTFCACNKRITKQHSVEQPYIEAVLNEWKMYVSILGKKPVIEEIHLGGGTPTFFSSDNLKMLIEGVFEHATKAANHEFSFEGHPNNTTKEQLQTLYNLGFRRVSFGIQDYNLKVQKAINRIQPFTNVENVTQWAREIGYNSIGHDLIFGLPFQDLKDVKYTIQQTKKLQPDRIAFYSYAHTPWIKGNGQRGFDEADLPIPDLKRIQYQEGKKALEEAGYAEVGMDHFALENDQLLQFQKAGKLHRNFMGYTTTQAKRMIGLGVSSISDSWFGFAQNEKDLKAYYKKIEAGLLPVFRGHILTNEDLIVRKHILNLMCNFETSWSENETKFIEFKNILIELLEMQADNLVILGKNYIKVTDQGQAFIRNVCMAFDLRLKANKPEHRIFSMTI